MRRDAVRASRIALDVTIPVDAQRRKFLVAFGIAYLGIGFSYIVAEPMSPVRMALRWIPVDFWLLGAMWMVCGSAAIFAAFLPSTRDKPGYWALSIPPTVWTLAYGVATVLHLITNYDVHRAWVSVIVFWVIATAVDTVAGMADAKLLVRDEPAVIYVEKPVVVPEMTIDEQSERTA